MPEDKNEIQKDEFSFPKDKLTTTKGIAFYIAYPEALNIIPSFYGTELEKIEDAEFEVIEPKQIENKNG